MPQKVQIITFVLVIINMIGFIIAGIDKYKAVRKLWRIREKVFFFFCIVGGCIGVYCGLLLFRHKTRSWYFMYGIPAIFVLQILLVYYIYTM